MVVMVEEDVKRWGTWEELILGGAVVRHGTDDWDAVASELQSRTLYAFLFTPQVCQAKYEELQHRYSGSTAWFEELRKRRVAELKRALEKSEDSIGSLELKLEWLKAQKGVCNSVDYSSSHTESPLQAFPKSEGIEFSGKYTSKENLSAGSFTQETNTNWSPQCSAPVDMLAEPAETELVSHSSERTCLPSTDQLAGAIYTERGLIIRKKRGKRMRKGCSMDAKEGSVGENYLLGSAKVGLTNLNCKETLNSDRGDTARSLDENDCKQCTSKEEVNDLMGILDSFMQNELVNMFRQRLDNQKRAQYKRIIRQHMDLDMIRSRVSRGSITSTRELFRDLLLLANNALVFYSKSTQEHRCAAILRDLVSSRLRRPYMAATSVVTAPVVLKPLVRKLPVKPRSALPFKCRFQSRIISAENTAPVVPKTSESVDSAADSPRSMELSAQTEKNPGQRGGIVGHVKRGSVGLQAETPMLDRNKALTM